MKYSSQVYKITPNADIFWWVGKYFTKVSPTSTAFDSYCIFGYKLLLPSPYGKFILPATCERVFFTSHIRADVIPYRGETAKQELMKHPRRPCVVRPPLAFFLLLCVAAETRSITLTPLLRGKCFFSVNYLRKILNPQVFVHQILFDDNHCG